MAKTTAKGIKGVNVFFFVVYPLIGGYGAYGAYGGAGRFYPGTGGLKAAKSGAHPMSIDQRG